MLLPLMFPTEREFKGLLFMNNNKLKLPSNYRLIWRIEFDATLGNVWRSRCVRRGQKRSKSAAPCPFASVSASQCRQQSEGRQAKSSEISRTFYCSLRVLKERDEVRYPKSEKGKTNKN